MPIFLSDLSLARDGDSASEVVTKNYVDTISGIEVSVGATQPTDPKAEWWIDTATTGISPTWMIWSGTQAAYDAIGTKDPMTLYIVKG